MCTAELSPKVVCLSKSFQRINPDYSQYLTLTVNVSLTSVRKSTGLIKLFAGIYAILSTIEET